MTKASLSIWIALALVGGALVGCGDDDPSTGGDSGMEADAGGDDDGGPPECEEAHPHDAPCDAPREPAHALREAPLGLVGLDVVAAELARATRGCSRMR